VFTVPQNGYFFTEGGIETQRFQYRNGYFLAERRNRN